jgi:hypothetical protein
MLTWTGLEEALLLLVADLSSSKNQGKKRGKSWPRVAINWTKELRKRVYLNPEADVYLRTAMQLKSKFYDMCNPKT